MTTRFQTEYSDQTELRTDETWSPGRESNSHLMALQANAFAFLLPGHKTWHGVKDSNPHEQIWSLPSCQLDERRIENRKGQTNQHGFNFTIS